MKACWTGLLAALVAGALAAEAQAQTAYPERTVRIIVPFPAGGATDILGRLDPQGLREVAARDQGHGHQDRKLSRPKKVAPGAGLEPAGLAAPD